MPEFNEIVRIDLIFDSRPYKGDVKGFEWQPHTSDTSGPSELLSPQETSAQLRDLANHIDCTTAPFPEDQNTNLARELAHYLSPIVPLPASIVQMTPDQITDLLDASSGAVLTKLPVSTKDFAPFTSIAELFRRAAEESASRLPDVPNQLNRAAIILRLSARSTDAGKAIATSTKSGENDRNRRTTAFGHIDAVAAQDPIYAAGRVAGAVYKRRRGEPYSFDGAPNGSTLSELRRVLG
jgi:hypothetical protein